MVCNSLHLQVCAVRFISLQSPLGQGEWVTFVSSPQSSWAEHSQWSDGIYTILVFLLHDPRAWWVIGWYRCCDGIFTKGNKWAHVSSQSCDRCTCCCQLLQASCSSYLDHGSPQWGDLFLFLLASSHVYILSLVFDTNTLSCKKR